LKSPPISTRPANFSQTLSQHSQRHSAVIEQLQAGELPGDRIPGMEYEIFKVRIKNSDIQKGKSAGYRAIYYLKTSDSIVLVTIYSKSDLSDIAAETVREILAQYEQQFPESEEL
jgi:mRNA-degrading endonuclease RelE of RelBE toxin-antitoxin system